jgi:catechol 2,3-dioxygenase-like lactoylglutathione lyase family enzyme
MNLFQVNLFVEDFPAMLRFYRDKLGFEANDIEPGSPAIPLVNWASLRTGSAVLELFDAATYGQRERLHNTAREAVELCFIVDDVARERARLEGAGIACDPVIEEGWGRYSAFSDPEGNRLQLFQVFDRRESD